MQRLQQSPLALISVSWLIWGSANGQPPADGIYWASESSDGLLVGLRLLPDDGCIQVNQPLEVQFLLKNTSDKAKAISCTAAHRVMFDVRDDNLLFERGQARTAAATQLTIEPGETLVPEGFRLSISTQQLLPGVYTIPELIGVWGRIQQQGGLRETNLGTVRKVTFTIEEPQQELPQASQLPEEGDAIVWGEPLMGISVGARLIQLEADGTIIDKSRRFHLNETLFLQLFLFNHRDSEVVVEIVPAQLSEHWEMSVYNEQKKRKSLRQLSRGYTHYRPSGFVSMKAGEQVAVTGVPIQLIRHTGTDLFEFESSTLAHAGVELISIGDRRLQNPLPLLEAELGGYFATSTLHIKLHRSDFSAAITSGHVPFRIVEDLLRK